MQSSKRVTRLSCDRTVTQWSKVDQRRHRLFWRIALITSFTQVTACMMGQRSHWPVSYFRIGDWAQWPHIFWGLLFTPFRLPNGSTPRHAGSFCSPDPGDPGAGWQVSVYDIWGSEHQVRRSPFGLGQILQCWSELRGSGLRTLLSWHSECNVAWAEGDPGGVLHQGPSEMPWLLPYCVPTTLEPTDGPPEKV